MIQGFRIVTCGVGRYPFGVARVREWLASVGWKPKDRGFYHRGVFVSVRFLAGGEVEFSVPPDRLLELSGLLAAGLLPHLRRPHHDTPGSL